MEHILFPFDFSRQAILTAPFVQKLACRLHARVTVLSVAPPPLNGNEEEVLRDRLNASLRQELPGVIVDRVVLGGDPAVRIADFAHSNKVDLIMMPTHGCGPFRRLLLGSVTAKILHDAHCPVWTAAHAEEQKPSDLPRTILCAVDRTPESVALMQWALAFSKNIGANLTLMHVVPQVSDWLAVPSERHLQEAYREEARVKIAALQREAGVDLPVRIAVGPVSAIVTEEARQEAADLVILGRGSLPGSMGRLRTHVYGIIQSSPCPVLSV